MATACARSPNSSWAHSWSAVSKASRSNRLKTRCKVDTAGVLLPLAPFETQPGSQIAMLPAPLVNGLEAVAVGQHGTDRQG